LDIGLLIGLKVKVKINIS